MPILIQCKDHSFVAISATVIALHCVFVIWSALFTSFDKPQQNLPPKRLVVQTISLSPPAPKLAAEMIAEEVTPEPLPEPANPPPPSPPPPTPEKPKEIKTQPKKESKKIPPPPVKPASVPKPKTPPTPKASPTPKAPTPKAPPTPKAAPTRKPPPASPKPLPPPAPKATTPIDKAKAEQQAAEKAASELQKKKEAEQQALEKARQQQLFAQAQERIAKIGQLGDKASSGKSASMPAVPLPTAITSLHIDDLPGQNISTLTEREVSYRDELATRLKLMLRLPEYGAVKIRLTLERSGKVSKIVVVSAESAVNRKHVEKTLPGLTFPAFGSSFSSEQEYTFAITLSNE